MTYRCCINDCSPFSASAYVWEHRAVHAVPSRLREREGPRKEQEVLIWHSSCSLRCDRRGRAPHSHIWER